MKRWIHRKIVRVSLLLIFLHPIVAYLLNDLRWMGLGVIGAIALWYVERNKRKERNETEDVG